MILALGKTFLVLIMGTMSGYLFQKWMRKQQFFTPEKLKKWAIFLQKLGMIWLMSITYIGSLWIFEIKSLSEIISLPLVGAVIIMAGGFFALVIAKYNHYNRIDSGSLFSCGFFANTVTLGGMICFFYLGEAGYALVPIQTFLMRLLYYGVGFPVARIYSCEHSPEENIVQRLFTILKDPFFNVGVGSVFIGLLLNLSSLPRPRIYTGINEIFIPLATFVLLFSVGLNLRFSRINQYLKECLYISLIKFLAVPLTTLAIAFLLKYQSVDNALPLKVSMIMAAMPVAFNSVIAANIYNLNTDLVNSCWVFTTFGVIFVLPLLLLFLNLF